VHFFDQLQCLYILYWDAEIASTENFAGQNFGCFLQVCCEGDGRWIYLLRAFEKGV
jgi:hypothetical protein